GRSRRIYRDNTSTKGRINPDTGGVSIEIRDRINSDTQTVSNEIRFEDSPQTPLLGRERRETEEDSDDSRPASAVGVSQIGIDTEPDSLRDLERWAEALPGMGMHYLGTWVGQMAGCYPPEWIRLAILEAVSADPE